MYPDEHVEHTMKLIRDNTPGLLPNTTRPANNDDEFEMLLRMKLMEEAAEVSAATSREEMEDELGDLWETISALAQLKKIPFDRILKARQNKRFKKGTFQNRIILMYDPPHNKHVAV